MTQKALSGPSLAYSCLMRVESELTMLIRAGSLKSTLCLSDPVDELIFSSSSEDVFSYPSWSSFDSAIFSSYRLIQGLIVEL